jgi:hypothetical protein
MRSRRIATLLAVSTAAPVLAACPADEVEVTTGDEPSPEAFCNVATEDVGTFDFAGARGFTDALGAMRRVQPVTPDEIRGDVDTIVDMLETVERTLPPEEPSLDVQSALVTAGALTEVDQQELNEAVGNVDAYIQRECVTAQPDVTDDG